MGEALKENGATEEDPKGAGIDFASVLNPGTFQLKATFGAFSSAVDSGAEGIEKPVNILLETELMVGAFDATVADLKFVKDAGALLSGNEILLEGSAVAAVSSTFPPYFSVMSVEYRT